MSAVSIPTRRTHQSSRFLYVRPQLVYRYQRLWGYRIRPEYAVSSRAFGISYIDRTQTLHLGLPYCVRESLPDFHPSYNRSFDEIVDERAGRLWQFSLETGRPLVVFWSGGIDSTLALTALLRRAPPGQLPRVLFSNSSIDEYPHYFHQIIRPHLRHQKLDALLSYEVPGAISVTGELGDQVFGILVSILAEDGSDFEILSQNFRPWLLSRLAQAYQTLRTVHLRGDLAHAFPDPRPRFVADRVLGYLEPQLQHCPFRILTVGDLLWWVQISLKWQAKQFQDVDPHTERHDEKHVQHFFDTPDFQCWSYANRDQILRGTWNSYKWQAKEYICRFSQDPVYAEQKTKHNSKQHVTLDVPELVWARKAYKGLAGDGRVKRELRWDDRARCHAQIDAGDMRLTGPELRRLSGKTFARICLLRDTEIQDDDLVHLQEFPLLEKLGLAGTQITDAGLRHLEPITGLRALGLAETQITDRGLALLAAFPRLRALWLDRTQITTAGLIYLADMQELRVLSLRYTQINDAGMDSLLKLQNLRRLYLDGCAISHWSVAQLALLRSLRVLRLCETDLTDDALVHLERLQELQAVDLSGTRISQQGAKALERRLPQTEVFF